MDEWWIRGGCSRGGTSSSGIDRDVGARAAVPPLTIPDATPVPERTPLPCGAVPVKEAYGFKELVVVFVMEDEGPLSGREAELQFAPMVSECSSACLSVCPSIRPSVLPFVCVSECFMCLRMPHCAFLCECAQV